MSASTRTAPDLAFLFNHAGHVVTTELTNALETLDTTPRTICLLENALGAELTQTRLGELCGLDKTTMVVAMDELERRGLAERRPAATDRRARIVRVTPAGERLLEAGRQVVDGAHLDMLAALPEEDREVFLRSLQTLVDGRLARPAECTRTVRRRR